jgi:hypothetical protein
MKFRFALTAMLLFGAQPAEAGMLRISATDSGWYDDSGHHGANNTNYIASTFSAVGGNNRHRNFFVFDLSSVSGNIISASLQLQTPNFSTSGNGTYTVHHVSTSTNDLTTTHISNDASGLAIYGDLGDGFIAGSTPVDIGFAGIVEVNLTPTALADLQSSVDNSIGLYAFGGTWSSSPDTAIFGSTNSSMTRQLVITTADPAAVPEPSSLALMAVTAGLVGYWRRKRVA